MASGKGGVGKSTTAVNLALGLAATGWRVGILDADVYGPSLPRLLGLDTKPEVEGKRMKPLYVFGIKAISIGFLVAEREAMIWRGPMVSSALKQLLREVDWGELDCLIVDMPPGTGEAQLTMAQSVPLAGAVIVSTPQDLALIDARRGVTMFQKTNVPILGIVENMSWFVCPHCQGRSDIFAHGGARHEAEALGVPFLGEIPLMLQIREQCDAGRPTVAVAPDSAAALAYREIAGRVRAGLEGMRANRRRGSSSSRGSSSQALAPTSLQQGARAGGVGNGSRRWSTASRRSSSAGPARRGRSPRRHRGDHDGAGTPGPRWSTQTSANP